MSLRDEVLGWLLDGCSEVEIARLTEQPARRIKRMVEALRSEGWA